MSARPGSALRLSVRQEVSGARPFGPLGTLVGMFVRSWEIVGRKRADRGCLGQGTAAERRHRSEMAAHAVEAICPRAARDSVAAPNAEARSEGCWISVETGATD